MVKDQNIFREVQRYLNLTAPVLFFLLSEKGVIVEANQYAHKILGTPLNGKKFERLIVDFTKKFDFQTFSMQDSTREYLITFQTIEGSPQSFYVSFRHVPEYVLVFGRLDSQEIEDMRHAVLCLNRDLNNLMRELHKKNAQLEMLNREKNHFMGMAAHDLRKPIGLIMAYSEFLMEDIGNQLNDEPLAFLNVINDSSVFMKRLVDDFLDVSAIEAGKFELDLQLSDIHTVLKQSLTLNKFQAAKKNIELSVKDENPVQPINMDQSKIEQAITNLVSNAIEHTYPGTNVEIRISCDEKNLSFSVHDQGPGIPLEDMKKLFKPFEKTSVKKTSGEKSTGLGMVITRKIIETHGGKVWVESLLGHGTTVSFTLPLK